MPKQEHIIDVYRQVAKNYDLLTKIYRFFWGFLGLRYESWRKKAIAALDLKIGDTVVDLGCGTGLNFSYFEKLIGPSGHIIGIDITDRMIEVAKNRVKKNEWKNVVLVLDDLANYKIPVGVDAIISTYALGLSESYDKIIRDAYYALKPGGKIAVLEFKKEHLSNWAKLIFPIWLHSIKDYSGNFNAFNRIQTWKSVKKYFMKSSLIEWYGGLAYLSVGIKDIVN